MVPFPREIRGDQDLLNTQHVQHRPRSRLIVADKSLDLVEEEAEYNDMPCCAFILSPSECHHEFNSIIYKLCGNLT